MHVSFRTFPWRSVLFPPFKHPQDGNYMSVLWVPFSWAPNTGPNPKVRHVKSAPQARLFGASEARAVRRDVAVFNAALSACERNGAWQAAGMATEMHGFGRALQPKPLPPPKKKKHEAALSTKEVAKNRP